MTSNQYIILIGTNINPETNLSRAKALISCITQIIHASKVFRTASIDPAFPDFLNQAVNVSTTMPKNILRKEFKYIEKQLYREHVQNPNASRTIDIDIILTNGKWCKDIDNILQHEQLLVAIYDLVPQQKLPSGVGLDQYFHQLSTHQLFSLYPEKKQH